MTIDLSGCAGEQKLSINSRTLAGARVAYKNLTAPLEPVNEGSFAALKVIIPEGNIMMARYPGADGELERHHPDRGRYHHHRAGAGDSRPHPGGASRRSWAARSCSSASIPKTGKRFVVQSLEGGGWGGRPHEDGESGSVSICQGDVRNGTLEGIELKNPVLVEERVLRQDSGGAGKFRGGLGIDLQGAQPGRGPLESRRQEPRDDARPGASSGGKPGDTACYLLKTPGENDFAEKNAYRHPVPQDSEVIVRTGGGGGWGDPLERDPDRGALGRDRGLCQPRRRARRLRRRARRQGARDRYGGDGSAARRAQGDGRGGGVGDPL